MRILAFDPGKHTGWAVLDDGKLTTGSYMAQGKDEAEVFIDWSSFASVLMSKEEPEAIAFEDVTFNRGRSYIPGMKALLYVKAHYRALTCFGVDVNTLKKFARGWDPGVSKWTGSKENMADALTNTRYTSDKDMDDNEVDAAFCAIWLDETATEEPAEGS